MRWNGGAIAYAGNSGRHASTRPRVVLSPFACVRRVIICSGYYGHLGSHCWNHLICLCFKRLAEITPVVLLPSERLPGPVAPPIIVLLW